MLIYFFLFPLFPRLLTAMIRWPVKDVAFRDHFSCFELEILSFRVSKLISRRARNLRSFESWR